MRILLKILAGLAIGAIVALVVLRITGLPPQGRRPGLWIHGTAVTTPVADWSWTDRYPYIEIQTQTWYLLPHSVTINCVAYKGELYLVSAYPSTTRHIWNDYVMRDPHVRLKIGDQVYDRTASVVTDPAVKAGVLQARHKKYPQLTVQPGWTVYVFHVAGG